MEIKSVRIETPKECNVIIGMSHFIKTVEDIYEAMVNSVPGIRFGLAFCESSGECLVRVDGTDEDLKKAAAENMLRLGCGHSFLIFLRGAYPINVLNAIKRVPEVCTIYAATANPLDVIVAETESGRGILGVIDGFKPRGIEDEKGVEWRKNLLRRLGYKR
ncbi:MAG: adenosine-specific kinase [Nitrososphaerota archaeon]|nr:adenosine-specific kinase [Candidatus Bathyarchaeota archaeon]MDW8049237.1 adenosine-specific kinase [Nitrososphaerota archaeon]